MNIQKLFLITFFISFTVIGFAQTNNRTHFNLDKTLAVQGYDPVSYFEGDSPTKGKKSINTDHKGAIYYFSNEKNKDKFISNPEKYEPQYGGWCAYAMGLDGSKVKIDPKTYKIVDGKLYLFYNFFFNNTLNSWNKDETQLKNKADDNWGKLLSK